MYYEGPVEAVVGQEVTFTAEFGARYLGPGPIPDVAVATVTHRAPEGFEFTRAEVTSYDWTPGRYPITVLDSSAAVDPVTGNVTVTAPAGGWAVPEIVINNAPDPTRYVSGTVFVKLRYTATEPVRDGASGLTFTGTDVPASEGWVTKGITQVAEAGSPQPGGFGSSGS
ncbi:hypothetical protein ACGFIU_25725 [Rhodococcus oryzae]|uniref:hypothetical protein n=1 Tax=Rhodococcus oryzae TaxID=2571143 RepID=UPI00371F0793